MMVTKNLDDVAKKLSRLRSRLTSSRVRKNDRSVTPRYGGVGFLVYYIYDDTW